MNGLLVLMLCMASLAALLGAVDGDHWLTWTGVALGAVSLVVVPLASA